MSNWDFLNKHRVRRGYFGSSPEDGFNGMFEFAIPGEARRVRCIASDGRDLRGSELDGLPQWQHVSVSFGPDCKACPSWALMCQIKELFFESEDVVMQLHPPKSQWINNHPGCLHLWRPVDPNTPIPTPPGIFVGIQQLGVLKR